MTGDDQRRMTECSEHCHHQGWLKGKFVDDGKKTALIRRGIGIGIGIGIGWSDPGDNIRRNGG